MSRRSSTTSTLYLALEPSRYARALRWSLWLALTGAVVAVAQKGYWGLAFASGAIALALEASEWRRLPVGIYLDQRGWRLRFTARPQQVPATVETLICSSLIVGLRLRFAGGSRAHYLFLWPDSAEADTLRRLRQRLQVARSSEI